MTGWDNSKFARWILKKNGIKKPRCGTSEEWSTWEAEAQTKSKAAYYFVQTILPSVQTVVCYPARVVAYTFIPTCTIGLWLKHIT
jgi:hypothetical protein